MAVQYQYKPLDTQGREIRIFTLHAGEEDDPLVGELTTVLQDEGVVYEALSYVWGPAVFDHTLNIVNNQLDGNDVRPDASASLSAKLDTSTLDHTDATLSINENLNMALRDIRTPDKHRVLWIDQICINQADGQERGHQVALMGRVFGEARAVVMWLDEHIDVNSAPFQALQRLVHSDIEGRDSPAYSYEYPSPLLRNRALRDSDMTVCIRDYESDFWKPVVDIFSNKYWKRLWIQQEIIVAKALKCYCRRDQISGADLLAFEEIVMNEALSVFVTFDRRFYFNSNSNRLFSSYARGRYLHERKGNIVWNSLSIGSLLNMVVSTTKLRVSDPKDRVYGLLGIACDCEPGDITVDYGSSLEALYIQVVEHSIRKYGTLEFLCHEALEPRDLSFSSSSLPSWLPAPEKWSRINELLRQWEKTKEAANLRNPDARKGQNTLSVQGSNIGLITVAEKRIKRETSIRQWSTVLYKLAKGRDTPLATRPKIVKRMVGTW